jgi:hypothetical protein
MDPSSKKDDLDSLLEAASTLPTEGEFIDVYSRMNLGKK